MRTVVRGGAIDFLMENEGDDDLPIDLDGTPVVNVSDPRGTTYVLASPTLKIGVGLYLYQHQSTVSDNLGFHTVVFIGTLDSRQIRSTAKFEVIAQ